MNFQEFITKQDIGFAVAPDGMPEQFWQQCRRADWMLWLVSRIVREQELKQEIVRVAADIAHTTLLYSKSPRAHDCIAAIDRWLAGEQVDLLATNIAAKRAVEDAREALFTTWGTSGAAQASTREIDIWIAEAARDAAEAAIYEDAHTAAACAARAAASARAIASRAVRAGAANIVPTWAAAEATDAWRTYIVRKHLPWTTIAPLLERALQEIA